MGTLRIGNEVVVPLLVQEGGQPIEVVQTTGDSTTSVMSQKATTEYPATQVKCSPSMVIDKGNLSYTSSIKTFSINDIKNIHLLRRGYGIASGSNVYDTCTTSTIRLYKDNNNYIKFGINGYTIKSEIKINGVILDDTTLFNFSASSFKNSNTYSFIDFSNKKMKWFYIESNELQTIVDYDFSAIDISNMPDCKIQTSLNFYTNPVAVTNMVINQPLSLDNVKKLLSDSLEYANYNSFSVTSYEDKISFDVDKINLTGGTLILNEQFHKIASYNMPAYSYINMGVYPTSEYSKEVNVIMGYKFKVTEGSVTLIGGAGIYWSHILKDGETVGTLFGSGSQPFTPELNVEYEIICKSLRELSYIASYNTRAMGNFTIEVYDGYLARDLSANFCAETWNGKYFQGAIPSEGINVLMKDYPYSSASAFADIPKYSKFVHTNGNIYMYNGTVWKQISN